MNQVRTDRRRVQYCFQDSLRWCSQYERSMSVVNRPKITTRLTELRLYFEFLSAQLFAPTTNGGEILRLSPQQPIAQSTCFFFYYYYFLTKPNRNTDHRASARKSKQNPIKRTKQIHNENKREFCNFRFGFSKCFSIKLVFVKKICSDSVKSTSVRRFEHNTSFTRDVWRTNAIVLGCDVQLSSPHYRTVNSRKSPSRAPLPRPFSPSRKIIFPFIKWHKVFICRNDFTSKVNSNLF